MTVALSALPQFFDQAGNPLAGGKVFTYAAGTSTPLATYTDRGGSTPNANPVILDASGRADIWLSTNVAYKIILRDSLDVVMDSVDQFYAGADPSQLTAAGIVPATGGAYTGLVDFQGGATFSGTTAQNYATLNSLGIAGLYTPPLWMNSALLFNQRAAGSTADGVYGYDRVVNLCETGSTTLSQLVAPTDGIPYAMRITQPDATPKRVGCSQVVEAANCLVYRGGQLVFAPKIRTSASTTVRVALVAWTGSIDAPTRDVVNNWASTNYTAGNFFVANTLTIATAAVATTAGTWTDAVVSSVSAGGVVVPSTMNNLYMVIWTEATQAQNATVDIANVRCAIGTKVPPWQIDYSSELTRCRRYYYRNSTTTQTLLAAGLAFSTTGAAYMLQFPTQMRAQPALSSTNLFPTNGAGGTIAPTGSTIGPGIDSVLVQINVASGLAAGQASLLYAGNGSGGFIAFDAEL